MTRTGTKGRLALGVVLLRALLPPASASAADAGPTPSAWAAALGEADRRFVAGDLSGALEVLQPLCATSDRSECAFALGAVQHGLGHCEEARSHYLRYRELAPQGEHSAEVAAALEEVETRCGSAPNPAVIAPVRASSGAAAGARLGSTVPAALPPAPATAARDPLNGSLIVGSLAVSGAAAASSVIFGILAARSAHHCRNAEVYDSSFIDECEERGPRYQGLWQGFAVVSGSFLGIGLTLWWLDARSRASVGVAGAGVPTLQYQRSF